MSIAEQIQAIIPDLGGQMANAASYLIKHPHDVAVYSMRELARHIGVPPVTLVRLAQRLGFPGYGELRQTYVDSVLRQAGEAGHATRRNIASAKAILADTGGANGLSKYAQAFFAGEIEVLRQASQDLSEPKLNNVAETLAKARRIFIIGRRTTYPPAFVLAYALKKARPDVFLLDDIAGAPEGPLDDAGEGDAMVAFTFAPFSRVTDTLARRAAASRVRLVGVSDSLAAPLRELAGDRFFLAPTQSQAFPESSAGAIALASLFAALVIAKLGDAASERITRNEDHVNASGEYMLVNKRSRKRITVQ